METKLIIFIIFFTFHVGLYMSHFLKTIGEIFIAIKISKLTSFVPLIIHTMIIVGGWVSIAILFFYYHAIL